MGKEKKLYKDETHLLRERERDNGGGGGGCGRKREVSFGSIGG